MENKIIRLVIVKSETNNILGFVALRSDGVHKYGFNESAQTRKDCMNKLMNELMRTYPSGIQESIKNNDVKGIKAGLIKNGYLIETKKDIITKLTIHEAKADSYFEIEYANKEKAVIYARYYTNIEDYNKILEACKKEIEESYGIVNITNFKGLVQTDEPEKSEEEDYDLDEYDEYDDPEAEEAVEEGFEKVAEETKTRNFKWTKRLLAVVTAEAIIALGAYNLGKNQEKAENTPSLEVVDTIELPTAVPIAPQTQMPISLPTAAPSNYMTPYERSLEPAPYIFLSYNPENSSELFTVIGRDGSEEVYDYNNTDVAEVNTENLYEVTNRNLSELLYFVNTGENPLEHYDELTAAPRRIHYERLIRGLNSIDMGYVKKFADYNNDIIYLGYILGDLAQAKEVNNLVVREMIRCVEYNQPLRYTVNGQEVCTRFTDLSYEAQDAIRNMCWGNYCLLGTDVVEFDGDYYNQARLGLDIYGLRQEPTSKR